MSKSIYEKEKSAHEIEGHIEWLEKSFWDLKMTEDLLLNSLPKNCHFDISMYYLGIARGALIKAYDELVDANFRENKEIVKDFKWYPRK